jgi:hypothetical protein
VGIKIAGNVLWLRLQKKPARPRDLTSFADEMVERSDRLPHQASPSTGTAFTLMMSFPPRVMALFHRAN